MEKDIAQLELNELNYAKKDNPNEEDKVLNNTFKKHILEPVNNFFKNKSSKIPQKVLIIRFGAIGDVVHTSNVYRSIKASYPSVKIHYLTSQAPSELINNDKDLEKVWIIKPNEIKFNSKYTNNYAQELRAENFDLVINLQPSLKAKYLVFKSGIKRQLTYKKSFKFHAVQNFWNTALKAFPDIKQLTETQIFLDKNTCEDIEKKLEGYKKPFIILNAGGIHSPRQGRTYPIDKWIELGNKLQEKYNGTIFITGVDEDAKELKELEQIPNSISFVGQLSLSENAALIKNSDYMISGDSGPLHIAMALGVKSIGLYGSMPIGRTGTYGSNGISIKSDYTCNQCNRRKCKYLKKSKDIYAPCMRAIEVKKILEALAKNLKQNLFGERI